MRDLSFVGFSIEGNVERLGGVERVSAADAHLAVEAPSHLHIHPFSGEVEARSDPLLDRTGNDDVAVETEGSRFPIRPDDTVLGEAKQIVVARGVIRTRVWTKAQSGEQVDRPVAPSEIPPADFEEAARGKFEPLFGHSCFGGLLQAFTGFETAAVSDACRRRFLDGHQDVVLGRTRVGDLGDLHAPEQPERGDAAAAFDEIPEAERPPGLQHDLARDDLFVRADVADDQDVVDDRLRAFGNPEREVDTGAVLGELRRHFRRGGGETTIPVLEQNRIAILNDRWLEVRRSGP